MTHPLTPREKVIEQLSHMARGKNTLYGSRVVAQMAIDHLTALASGSGDHAELALNAKAAQTWALGIYENREQAARRSTFIDSDLPATVLALLAENAALRDSVVKANDGFEEYERKFYLAEDRATEAERKLAEAVGLLREWMGTWFVDADSRGESAIADDTRKFLSKEAERG